MTDPTVARLLALREHFRELGDRGLVAECEHQLARAGHLDPVPETAQPPELERAVPRSPRRRREVTGG